MRLFWSYARLDNQKPNEKVTRLKGAFDVALSQVTGEKCEVYFDVETNVWGTRWQAEIEKRIDECDGVVATITPSFFNSYEWQGFYDMDQLPIQFNPERGWVGTAVADWDFLKLCSSCPPSNKELRTFAA